METLEELYNRLCGVPSDISEHLPTLGKYGQGRTVTEFGVREGVSTINFLQLGARSLVSYDTKYCDIANHSALASRRRFVFFNADSLAVTIANTQVLFIDSAHNFKQLRAELYIHQSKVSDYIVMHDTVLFRNCDEIPSCGPGLQPAITEFLLDHPQWYISEEYMNNNGLTVLARKK